MSLLLDVWVSNAKPGHPRLQTSPATPVTRLGITHLGFLAFLAFLAFLVRATPNRASCLTVCGPTSARSQAVKRAAGFALAERGETVLEHGGRDTVFGLAQFSIEGFDIPAVVLHSC
jgi:hypothetical protein